MSPASDITLDRDGTNTRATVRNTTAVFDRRKILRVMVVGLYCRLPRVEMSYLQQGREVLTVPAKESCTLGWTLFYIAREIVALWKYYLEPLDLR